MGGGFAKGASGHAKPHRAVPKTTDPRRIPHYQPCSVLAPRLSPFNDPTYPPPTMSLIRAGTACFRAGRLVAPLNARFVSANAGPGGPSVKTSPSDAPTTTHKSSTLIRHESPSEAMARHQPDYDATIDAATSYEPSWIATMNGQD